MVTPILTVICLFCMFTTVRTNDSDPNFQKSYQILTTFLGEILPISDLRILEILELIK